MGWVMQETKWLLYSVLLLVAIWALWIPLYLLLPGNHWNPLPHPWT